MQETKPLPYVISTLTLNSFQKEEFERTLVVYSRVYNYLLLQWIHFSKSKPLNHIGDADSKFISERLRSLIHFAEWIEKDLELVASCAAREFVNLLHIRYNCTGSSPTEEDMKKDNLVIFHREYDVRLKNSRISLPVIGKIITGRFNFFSGSIRAVGIRQDYNLDEFHCLIYYKENTQLFDEKDPKCWTVKGQEIPKSRLNIDLRKAGIGYMK
jgi:hypothetical protein